MRHVWGRRRAEIVQAVQEVASVWRGEREHFRGEESASRIWASSSEAEARLFLAQRGCRHPGSRLQVAGGETSRLLGGQVLVRRSGDAACSVRDHGVERGGQSFAGWHSAAAFQDTSARMDFVARHGHVFPIRFRIVV